ncbi:MAG: CDP-alcohol phosphatidyltransferase family protein [Prevotella sp.]|nr:CDP-alcohol phosphatidyltransferase family protein [Prevotella sp.]
MEEKKTFGQLLRASFKSDDTEEWLDVHFTRPIGLAFALLWNRLGIHPNAITILSIFLGAAAGYLFSFTDVMHNLGGVVLLMLANFCDSTDGQMARLTGKKTLVGRVLDGFSGDVWFFCIYLAIVWRTTALLEPYLGAWAVGLAFALCYGAGVQGHSKQSSLADYYRQIHLFFLLGREGSELDDYATQRRLYEQTPKKNLFARAFYYNYANYCRSQERRTSNFQQLYHALRAQYPNAADIPQALRDEFRAGSLPLMKYTNLLTFNARAILVYVSCLLNVPYLYPLAELTVFQWMYYRMRARHEALCARIYDELLEAQGRQTTTGGAE